MRKSHNRLYIESIRLALVDLRRLFQRRELATLWAAAAGGPADLDYGDLRLLDAVHAADLRDGSATVGDVSRGLGVDPSRASREVARAVRRGLLARRAAQDDGRKVVLAITPRGARLQEKGSELTRARIALAVATWSDAECERFAQLLPRFVAAITAT